VVVLDIEGGPEFDFFRKSKQPVRFRVSVLQPFEPQLVEQFAKRSGIPFDNPPADTTDNGIVHAESR
jgi:hypothetical protein